MGQNFSLNNGLCQIQRKKIKYLQFDLRATRSERLQTVQFAIVSEIMYTFTENTLFCYKTDENETTDEQPFPRKAHCSFT